MKRSRACFEWKKVLQNKIQSSSSSTCDPVGDEWNNLEQFFVCEERIEWRNSRWNHYLSCISWKDKTAKSSKAMALAGQTINDRLLAAKHSLAGQGLAKSVCKATTEELLGPKKKHLDCEYLNRETAKWRYRTQASSLHVLDEQLICHEKVTLKMPRLT